MVSYIIVQSHRISRVDKSIMTHNESPDRIHIHSAREVVVDNDMIRLRTYRATIRILVDRVIPYYKITYTFYYFFH